MMKLTEEIWSRGLSYEEYRATISRNLVVFDEVYADPSLRASDLELLQRLPPLRVVAIAEDWCPDVCHTLPTWARVAERLDGWQLKVFAWDTEPDLTDSFVWNEKLRRVPVYAFHDVAGRLQVWWSGRGGEAEAEVSRLLGGRKFTDLDPSQREAIGRALDSSYRKDLRRRNLAEILAMLAAFFHLPEG